MIILSNFLQNTCAYNHRSGVLSTFVEKLPLAVDSSQWRDVLLLATGWRIKDWVHSPKQSIFDSHHHKCSRNRRRGKRNVEPEDGRSPVKFSLLDMPCQLLTNSQPWWLPAQEQGRQKSQQHQWDRWSPGPNALWGTVGSGHLLGERIVLGKKKRVKKAVYLRS